MDIRFHVAINRVSKTRPLELLETKQPFKLSFLHLSQRYSRSERYIIYILIFTNTSRSTLLHVQSMSKYTNQCDSYVIHLLIHFQPFKRIYITIFFHPLFNVELEISAKLSKPGKMDKMDPDWFI